jgi:hypothetical protein
VCSSLTELGAIYEIDLFWPRAGATTLGEVLKLRDGPLIGRALPSGFDDGGPSRLDVRLLVLAKR